MLHRALRVEGVRFRYVELAPSAAAPPGGGADYETIRQQGTPDGVGGVLLIEPRELPADRDDALVAAWEALQETLAARRGHLGSRLLRATTDTPLRVVGVTRWSSPLMWFRAGQQDAVRRALEELPGTPYPAMYQPVHG